LVLTHNSVINIKESYEKSRRAKADKG